MAVNLYTLLPLQFLIFMAFSSFYRLKGRKRLSLKPFPHSQKKKKCTQPELSSSSVWFQEISYLFYEPGDDPLLFHLLILMNETKSLWIFCVCTLCPYHTVCLGRHYHFFHQISYSSPLLLSPSLPALPPLAPADAENKCHHQPTEEFPYAQCVLRKRKLKAALSLSPQPPDIWRLTGHSGLASPALQSDINHSQNHDLRQASSENLRKWDKARALQQCMETQTKHIYCVINYQTPPPKRVTAASLSITHFSCCSVFTPEKMNWDTQA